MAVRGEVVVDAGTSGNRSQVTRSPTIENCTKILSVLAEGVKIKRTERGGGLAFLVGERRKEREIVFRILFTFLLDVPKSAEKIDQRDDISHD